MQTVSRDHNRTVWPDYGERGGGCPETQSGCDCNGGYQIKWLPQRVVMAAWLKQQGL